MPRAPKLPPAPEHLSKDSKALWEATLRTWGIDDETHRAVLRVALEARDRAEKCRRQIDADGEVVTDRFGQRKGHPLLSAERDARSQFVNCIAKLGLDPSEVA